LPAGATNVVGAVNSIDAGLGLDSLGDADQPVDQVSAA
jgi:hypothetical protein